MIKQTLLYTALLLTTLGSANAQVLDEGCDVLADVVQRSIVVNAPNKAQPGTRTEFGLYRCSMTAATATQAFTESMRQMRIPVRWESPGVPPGDVCLSHDIDQCYPRGGSLSDSGLPGRYQFVRNSWAAVHRSLQLTIQRSLAPDVSFFQTGTLEHTVKNQLRATRQRAGELFN